MVLRWIDGAEVWGDPTYQLRAYAQGSSGFGTGRILPGVRSILFNTANVFLTTPSLGQQNTWIVGFGLKLLDSAPSTEWSWRFLNAGVEQCRLEMVDNGSTFDLALKRGATTIATTSQQFAYGVWHHFELAVTVRTSTNGAYELRQNENTVLSGSSVNLADSGADGCDAHSYGRGSTGTGFHEMDDINIKDDQGTVNNTFLGDQVCTSILPTSDGASSQFTPSSGGTHFNLVDDPSNAASAADYVSSDVNGQKDLYG